MSTIAEALAAAKDHHRAGRLAEAELLCRQILAAQPNSAEAMHLLGVIAHQLGRHADALDLIGRAIALAPLAERYHNSLGLVYVAVGRSREAITCFQRAIELRPDLAAAHSNLGNALRDLGELDAAVAAYRRAVELKPGLAEAHFNLANAVSDQGKPDEAVAAYGQALQAKPVFPAAHNNLGTALRELGRLDESIACFRRAIGQQPDHAGAHNNLGNALRDAGEPDAALACFRRALELRPDFAAAHSNLLMALQFRPGVGAAELRRAHAEYDRDFGAPLRAAWRPHDNQPDPNRRLRLGFVSPDFARHPVGYFLIRVLENLDRRQCDVVCYSDRVRADPLTARCQAAAGEWHRVSGKSHDELAAEIRTHQIDVLFDLAGHTARNRLAVFARRPAPIQITWLGYVGTTGLAAMDYLLADRHEVPPGAEAHYCEKILRLPDSYVCFDPPGDAPAVGPLPALGSGQVTFGSFNNPAKIAAEVVAVWSEILRRVAGSRLVLRYSGMDDPANARRIGGLLAGHGIAAERVELSGRASRDELLECYHRVDVALDPFPYSGGLTTCEALWMGVPVVTWPGETFAGRHSLGHLSTIGLTETIAGDLDEYVEIAVRLANDLPRLAEIRAGLRQRAARSPLCDGKRFAENLMQLVRNAWHEWCAGAAQREPG